jgi:DNA-directed RNA polymerase subunit M/transcription elongation factor TFIIS
MRQCPKCGNTVPYKIRIDGKTYWLGRRKYCFDCSPWKQHNTRVLDERQQDKRRNRVKSVVSWRQRVKEKAVALLGGECSKCGYCRCIRALTFHHRDPDGKNFPIGGTSVSWKRIQEEAKKCDLLCANCHAEVHEAMDQQNILNASNRR